MIGCIRITRNHHRMECWTKDLDDYVWTLAQALKMLPDVVEIRAGWVMANEAAFTEQRVSRVDGEVREWTRTS